MKKTELKSMALSLAIMVFSSVGYSATLNQSQGDLAMGILSVAGVIEQFPAAEYAQVEDLSCNLDRVAGDQVTCSGLSEQGPLSIAGKDAEDLFNLLTDYAEVQEFPAAEYVEIKALTCNLDYLTHETSCRIQAK